MRYYSREQCDELDERVRQVKWTDDALEYGSPERIRVAGWLVEARIVDDAVTPIFPDPGQARLMVEYTREKVVEKILGRAISSRECQWNWQGLWDPLETRDSRSFCGWARNLAKTIAHRNAGRVLHSGPVNTGALETQDEDGGYNKAYDSAGSRNLLATSTIGVFDEHPQLIVPRPVGADRDRLMRLVTNCDEQEALEWMKRTGWWHHSLDMIDPSLAIMLLLAPVPKSKVQWIAGLLPDIRLLAEAYAPTQKSRYKADDKTFRRLLTVQAVRDDQLEWTLICRLGTAAAQLAAN